VVPKEKALQNLLTIVRESKNKLAGRETYFSRTLIGLAGIDTQDEIAEANQFFNETLKAEIQGTIRVVNDSEIALASGTNSSNAIVVISGTGSNCFGRNDMGETAKAGGLDYLLSDEGSAYFVGIEILHAAVKSTDGRGKKTVLEELIKNYFSLTDMLKIKEKVYQSGFTKASVAHLCLLLPQAIETNDEIAIGIRASAIAELALMAQAVARKLSLENQPFDLVASGGMFNDQMLPLPDFSTAIKAVLPQANIIRPEKPPVYGGLSLLMGNPEQHY